MQKGATNFNNNLFMHKHCIVLHFKHGYCDSRRDLKWQNSSDIYWMQIHPTLKMSH